MLCAAALAAVASAPVAAQTLRSSAGDIAVETVARGLDHPWGFAFLPDGRMLVTERPGRMRIVAQGRQALAGARRRAARCSRRARAACSTSCSIAAMRRTTPSISATPSRRTAAPARRSRARAWSTKARRGSTTSRPIFRQEGPLSSGQSFRLPHRAGRGRQPVPDHGRSLRLRATRRRISPTTSARSSASGPTARCRPTIRSSADRAPSRKSGATATAMRRASRSHPATGKLWEHEHGPRGGDEVNIIEKGKNYGWPVIGFGIDYSGAKIHEGTQKAGMEQPVWHWVPSIAPSGMTFYTGGLFPAWRGNLFVGALAGQSAGAARGRRREGGQGRAARAARAHPRRPPGAGRRAVARHRQLLRPDSAGRAGEIVTGANWQVRRPPALSTLSVIVRTRYPATRSPRSDK